MRFQDLWGKDRESLWGAIISSISPFFFFWARRMEEIMPPKRLSPTFLRNRNPSFSQPFFFICPENKISWAKERRLTDGFLLKRKVGT